MDERGGLLYTLNYDWYWQYYKYKEESSFFFEDTLTSFYFIFILRLIQHRFDAYRLLELSFGNFSTGIGIGGKIKVEYKKFMERIRMLIVDHQFTTIMEIPINL